MTAIGFELQNPARLENPSKGQPVWSSRLTVISHIEIRSNSVDTATWEEVGEYILQGNLQVLAISLGYFVASQPYSFGARLCDPR